MSDGRRSEKADSAEMPLVSASDNAADASAAFHDLVYRPNSPNGAGRISTELAQSENTQFQRVSDPSVGTAAADSAAGQTAENSGAAYANANYDKGSKSIESDADFYNKVHAPVGADPQAAAPATDQSAAAPESASGVSQGAPMALDPSLWSSEPDTDKVMIGWAVANGAKSENQNDYILGVQDNYFKSSTSNGQTQIGPWNLNQDIVGQWAGGIDQTKLAEKVQSKQISEQTAKMLSTPEFGQFVNGLASGQEVTADQISKFMPAELQTTIAADLSRGMAQAETAQLGQFDPGATVAAIQAGKVLDQNAVADPNTAKLIRAIDSQLINMGSYPGQGQGGAADSAAQNQSAQPAEAASNAATTDTGSYVTNASAIPGETVGTMFVNPAHNPQDQQIGENVATQASSLPGETIGSLFVNTDGITGANMGVSDSRASLLNNSTRRA